MDLVKDSKGTCPSCNDPNMKDAKMIEEGIEIPVKLCPSCSWWG